MKITISEINLNDDDKSTYENLDYIREQRYYLNPNNHSDDDEQQNDVNEYLYGDRYDELRRALNEEELNELNEDDINDYYYWRGLKIKCVI